MLFSIKLDFLQYWDTAPWPPTHIYIYIYIYNYTHMFRYTNLYTYIHICLYIFTYKYTLYRYIPLYLHIYIYIYIYIYGYPWPGTPLLFRPYIYIYTYTEREREIERETKTKQVIQTIWRAKEYIILFPKFDVLLSIWETATQKSTRIHHFVLQTWFSINLKDRHPEEHTNTSSCPSYAGGWHLSWRARRLLISTYKCSW